MIPAQPQLEPRESPIEPPIVEKTAALERDGEIASQKIIRRTRMRGHPPEQLLDFGSQRAADHRHALLDDAALFAGNGEQVSSQIGLVVPGNGRDNRYRRHNEIGRVEPASEPHLYHGHIRVQPGKIDKAHDGHKLEEGERDPGLGRAALDLPGQLHHFGRRDLLVPYPNALGKGNHMGRSVKGGAIARERENAVQHRRGRALAIRARDMERGITPLRMAEQRESPLYPIEPEVDLAPAQIENIVQCLRVSHS